MNTTSNTLTLLAEGANTPNGWIWAMAIGFAVICVIMMLIVLIQKPKGGGLSGAFGGGAGGGSTQAVIGARVGDVLTWATVVCFVLFLVLAMGMTWAITGSEDKAAEEEKQKQAAEDEAPADEDDEEPALGTTDEDAAVEEDNTADAPE